jgi:putative redox protein
MTMTAKASWINGRMFVGESGSGHAVVMDGAPEHGGRNLGIRPMEMLLIGLAGCTAFDVVHILEKSRQAVTGCEVSVSAERAATDPKVFTEIRMTYRLKGRALAPAQVERAITLSKEKYCSASIMLGATAAIIADWTTEEA